MRFKYPIGFFISIVTLASAAFFYRSDYLADNASPIEGGQKPLTEAQGANITTAPKKSVQKDSVASNSVPDIQNDDLSALSSAAEIQDKYRIPSERRVEFFRRLLEKYETDPTGYVKFMIAKVLHSCAFAPKSESDLKKKIADSETRSLGHGVGSGHILRNTKRLEKEYTECKQIHEDIGDIEYRQLLEDAAYLDNEPRAKMYLALSASDPNFLNWSEDLQLEHKREMGGLIQSARSQCDPFAFAVLGAAESYGEGELWLSPEPEDMPKLVSQYANRWAYGAYYANKTNDAREILNEVSSQLRRLSAELSAEQVAIAEMYGSQLFRMHCVN